VTLIDAMAGYPNPTRELLKEAQQIFGEDAKVATVISIGSGKKRPSNLSARDDQHTLMEAVKDAVINAEITHEELKTRLRETHLYFRFNVHMTSELAWTHRRYTLIPLHTSQKQIPTSGSMRSRKVFKIDRGE